MEAQLPGITTVSPSSAHRDWAPAVPDDGSTGTNGRGGVSHRRRRHLPARVAGAVARGVITSVFAAVGAVLGAVTGALIGLANESGLVRGAGVGAISGAVVSMEVAESSLAIWRSNESAGIRSVLYVLDVIWSLLTGRLVREKVDPAVQSAVESQMSAADPTTFGEPPPALADMFGLSAAVQATTGMTAAAIEALPATTLAASGERVGCSVCLQDVEPGEAARSLPGCAHTFHLPCIDSWLRRHASCPLCRRAVV